MAYSRRNFLKAAGSSAAALTTVGVSVAGGGAGEAAAQTASPLAIPAPMGKETGTFTINEKTYRADYEARTTLWEVIHNKLGLTGTNRSCNRASCGACSVLLDGVPFYSCHTLATEGVGKQSPHGGRAGGRGEPASAAARGLHSNGGRLRVLHGGMVSHGQGPAGREPRSVGRRSEKRVVRPYLPLRAYDAIIETVVDTGRVMRGEAEIA